ncbi:amino acid ABC transporter substrate-binding protein (PAAT family) [Streptomyces sp. 1114.5]|uniref:ABC transporter substrate-binding protein n=1 Tax=unclassified Streptomyces TaxID=2593676 RepID=UPI000BD9E910|nr:MULTISPECIES: ABC transporter substrate-binding protein [unclassified Streptomyces]RKT15950.1 amino acid ABC transporter substrate-binding protein (PAAT family) [Streptomyces sp. 1114.5]SOB82124.1 amino acid ABC transporter substrate-binding protein, PAAT family [Streptomyces sp. 1331.2]
MPHPLPARRPALAGAVLATAGALLLTGCSGGGQAAPTDPVKDVRDKLPKAQRTAGVLRIGMDVNYAPVEFRGPDGKPTGLDPDLATALGKILDVRVEFVDTPFDKLIPNLQGKQYDVAMSAISDIRQRREGTPAADGNPAVPGVDFVDYFIAGTSIVVPKGNPKGIKTLDDLCGKTIAFQQGTNQDEIATRQVAVCARTGRQLTTHKLDSDAKALAEVASGVAAAGLNDFPVAAFAAKSTDGGTRFEVTGGQSTSNPYGIAVRKSDTELRDALAKAVDQLIRSGEYDKVLAKWNVSAGAAQNAVVNGGI